MKKILIIRFSSIGDVVLISPVIRCLKMQLPDAELHVLTLKANRLLFEHNPFISRIFTPDPTLKKIIGTLRNENYDYIVDLHKNLRSMFVKLSLRKHSASFPKLNIRKYLLVRFKINIMPDIHIVDRYFQAVKQLGVQNDGNGLDYFLPPPDYDLMKQVAVDFGTDNFPDGFVAVVIGAKHNTKILPVEKVAGVCEQLSLPAVLLGGKEDAARGSQIVDMACKPIVNACGSYSLHQSAMIIKLSRAVLTNDTGLMHIAAAFRKPTVSVWGNTVPDLGMYPYMPGDENKSVKFSVTGLSCRPCSKIGYQKCPKGHFQCMLNHDNRTLAEALDRFTR
ncbi:MAG: glycosyltransferase family 9 protein [Bacteroidales bacterium]|nr:glycosyltransferase family 9 protein [Bacteroidales bacterium]